jgi:hypothetical protein
MDEQMSRPGASDSGHEPETADALADFASEQAPGEDVVALSKPPAEGLSAPEDARPDSVTDDGAAPLIPAVVHRRWMARFTPTPGSNWSSALASPARALLRAVLGSMRRARLAGESGAARLGRACQTRCARLGSLAPSWAGATRRHGKQALPAALFLLGVMVGAALAPVARRPFEAMATTVAAPSGQRAPRTTSQPASGSSGITLIEAARSFVTGSATSPAGDTPGAELDAEKEETSTGQAQYYGSLAVDSEPRGAGVFLNGEHVGTTPLLLDSLLVGSRVVRVALGGHESWSRAITVVSDQRTDVVAALRQSRP